MNVELRDVWIHPSQRTLICPACGREGRHLNMLGPHLDESTFPATCQHCNDVFLLHTTQRYDVPLRVFASALNEAFKNWRNTPSENPVQHIDAFIETLSTMVPDLQKIPEQPGFRVEVQQSGALNLFPKNSAALRVLDIVRELTRQKEMEGV